MPPKKKFKLKLPWRKAKRVHPTITLTPPPTDAPPPLPVQHISPPPTDAPPPLPTTAQQAQPAQEPSGSTTTLTKTRRQSVKLTTSLPDVDRHRENAEANKRALEKIYNAYYRNGKLKGPFPPPRKDGGPNQGLYNLMGKGAPGYAKEPIKQEDYDELAALPGTEITAQKMSSYLSKKEKYDEAMAKYDPDSGEDPPEEPKGVKTISEALEKGDYFHVWNKAFEDAGKKRAGRARRIIVNVKSQTDGLVVSKALATLFSDPEVGPNFSQFKIYLSKTSQPDRQMKEDKLVLYYTFAGNPEDGTDTVGNRLAAAIEESLPKGAAVDSFAPFYSRIGHGMAWAEEPKYYIPDMAKGSYTESRALVIEKVLRDNDTAPDVNTFADLVNKGFRDRGVDPDRAQTHFVKA
jgi:hypothetical protein